MFSFNIKICGNFINRLQFFMFIKPQENFLFLCLKSDNFPSTFNIRIFDNFINRLLIFHVHWIIKKFPFLMPMTQNSLYTFSIRIYENLINHMLVFNVHLSVNLFPYDPWVLIHCLLAVLKYRNVRIRMLTFHMPWTYNAVFFFLFSFFRLQFVPFLRQKYSL